MAEIAAKFRNAEIRVEYDENERPLYSLFKNGRCMIKNEKAIRYIKQIMYQIAD